MPIPKPPLLPPPLPPRKVALLTIPDNKYALDEASPKSPFELKSPSGPESLVSLAEKLEYTRRNLREKKQEECRSQNHPVISSSNQINAFEQLAEHLNENFEWKSKFKDASFFKGNELLGQGAYSEVWDAKYMASSDACPTAGGKAAENVFVAKIFKKEPDGTDLLKAKEAFDLEKAAYAGIGPHPHIAKMLRSCKMDGAPTLIIERLTGGKLVNLFRDLHLLRENRREYKNFLKEEEYWGVVQYVFKSVLKTLSYMQERGFSNRDVKPDNIILDEKSGVPKIIDLGSTDKIGDPVRSVGIGYCPSENQLNRDLKISSFSLSMMAYELILGNTGADVDEKNRFAFGGATWNPDDELTPELKQERLKTIEDWCADWTNRPLKIVPLSLENSAQMSKEVFSPSEEFREYLKDVEKLTGKIKDLEEALHALEEDDLFKKTRVVEELEQARFEVKNLLPPERWYDKQKGVYASNTAYVQFVNDLSTLDPDERPDPRAALNHEFLRDSLLSDEEAQAVILRIIQARAPSGLPLIKTRSLPARTSASPTAPRRTRSAP